MVKLVSWNVNGLRAAVKKGFLEFVQQESPDVLCLQETKMKEGQLTLDLPGYHQYFYSAERPGYSGTALFSKVEPLCVTRGIGVTEHDTEGRVLTAEYEDYFLVCVYTPNSGRELARLPYRVQWEEAFRTYLTGLRQRKGVVVCGDMNVAHEEIDLKNPKPNRGNAGFTDEERQCFSTLLSSGFIDSFRYFYPDKTGAYSWWSYLYHARDNNAGWRIDYFLVSEDMAPRMADSLILKDVYGSDHCPVALLLNETKEKEC